MIYKKSKICIVCMLITLILCIDGFNVSAEESGSWTTKANMLTERFHFGVESVGEKIYAFGGARLNEVLSSVEEYNSLTDKWTNKSTMPDILQAFGTATVNGKIYIIGGTRKGKVLNTVNEYDPITDKWTTKANMPTERRYLDVCVVDGKIYAIGGWNSLGYSNKVEEYDPINDSWTTKADMITARSSLSVVQENGKIYALGGRDNYGVCSQVEKYDPDTNKWISMESMITGRYDFGVSSLNDKIYIFGGVNSADDVINTVEEYDIINKTWITLEEKMPKALSRPCVTTLNEDIYIIGGYNGHGVVLSDTLIFNPNGKEIIPDTPINLIATAGDNQIVLNWDKLDDDYSYIVKRSTISSSIGTIIARDIENTSYIDADVEPGITYYYVVQAVKDNIVSEDSNIASAMVEKNTNTAVLQIKLSTTDVYEYRITMNEADNFMKWYIDRSNGTGLPFYSFSDESKIEPYTDINEYLIFDKIIWFKVKEYLR